MTYKLEPIVERIKSPVALVLPNDEELNYGDGRQAFAADYESRYQIQAIEAIEGAVRITLKEMELLSTDWASGASVSFF